MGLVSGGACEILGYMRLGSHMQATCMRQILLLNKQRHGRIGERCIRAYLTDELFFLFSHSHNVTVN